jgi:hypothetical protein
MKVISFDVGIKNLAYCLFDIPDGGLTGGPTGGPQEEQNTKITISDWKVISLMESEEPIPKCNQPLMKKKGKKTEPTPVGICNHMAKYKQTDITLCDKHAKAVAADKQWLLPENRFKKVKKMKLEEVVELATSFGFSPTAKAKKPEVLSWVEDFLSKKCLIPVSKKTKNAGEADLISLGHSMKKVFKDILPDDISCVLIENQISTLATRMKTVQGMLAQYFIMRYEGIRVEFISSANKLKMFSKEKKEKSDEKNTEEKKENKKTGENKIKEKKAEENKGGEHNENSTKTQGQKYKEHKKDGVFYCEKVLADKTFLGGEQWGQIERKKKDDLADCFLQGVWWLNNEKFINM